ncbi:MAG: glycosyltransferase [Kiritimatiellae bacterium]|nr:glycosyltransferase [Kiritimatiellia bacterium]
MKIAFVTDAYNYGRGGDVATIRMAEGLKKRGHVITVVAALSVQTERFFQVRGFYPPLAKEAFTKGDFIWGIPEKKVLRKAFADVDLIQVQHPFVLGYGAVKVAKAMGKPVIGAFHAQPQNILGMMGLEGRFKEYCLAKLFMFSMFNRVPFLQCPSQFAADIMKKSGCRSALRVVSNGIPAEFKETKESRPEWFGDKLVLLSIGRLSPEKRQKLMVEGVKRSKYANQIQLVLCGQGADMEALKVLGEELPVKPFIEHISDADKLTYLNTADMFLQASIVELESLSCLEAIGCGLPCLIADSQHSAATQFALDDRFLFTSDDADSLAGKIDYWFENRAELKAHKQKILAMAENYNMEKCLDKMEALYAEALQHHSSQGSK